MSEANVLTTEDGGDGVLLTKTKSLSENGRVYLSVTIRDILGVREGDEVEFVISNGGTVELRKPEE